MIIDLEALAERHSEITYHRGDTRAISEAYAVISQPSGSYFVIADKTSFHPLDHKWPDQPSDAGFIKCRAAEIPVDECLTGAYELSSSSWFVGSAIPVGRGQPGWTFHVMHRVSEEGAERLRTCQDPLVFEVETTERRAISTAHTANHLAALALNSVVEPYWRKEIPRDSLGNRDFDRSCIVSSRIDIAGSTEIYRLGKSARKRGLNRDQLLTNIPEIQGSINMQVTQWIKKSSQITINPWKSNIADARIWVTDLGGKSASLPCGGTHRSTTGDLPDHTSISLSVDQSGEQLTMRTCITAGKP